MDRTAVFVDAGYLFAAGSNLLVNEKLVRGELHLDHTAILKLLEQIANEASGLALLRVYWYDGTSGVPTPQQLALAYQPGVKLRLGFVNQYGQQRGVDSLIITDLIHLARNGAMADAVVMTGDEDIRVGVQQAQELGVRVHLVGIAPVRENQSSLLRQEADTLLELSLAEVQTFLKPLTEGPAPRPQLPRPPPPPRPLPPPRPRRPPPGRRPRSRRVHRRRRATSPGRPGDRRRAHPRGDRSGAPGVFQRLGALEPRPPAAARRKPGPGQPADPELKRLIRATFPAACRTKAAH